MERDLTRWLKDDLGLRHMSEADLTGLMYHPRHGNLCRRFVKFLADTTLCSKKYPNVTARDDCQTATEALDERNHELHDTMLRLEQRIQMGDNIEQELVSLKKRRDYLKRMEDLIRTTNEALEEMANRPNYCFEQVRKSLECPKYLEQTPLEDLYSNSEKAATNLLATTQAPPASERLQKKLEERYNHVLDSVEILHRAIGQVLAEAQNCMRSASDQLSELEKPIIDDLEALKVPTCEIVELPADHEEQGITGQRRELICNILSERQQVCQLKQQYVSGKRGLNEQYERELKEDLDFLTQISHYEAIVHEFA